MPIGVRGPLEQSKPLSRYFLFVDYFGFFGVRFLRTILDGLVVSSEHSCSIVTIFVLPGLTAVIRSKEVTPTCWELNILVCSIGLGELLLDAKRLFVSSNCS